jgi:hypothetical protein
MVKQLCAIGDFVRKLRNQARFGKLSRAPLRLLRLEFRGRVAECEWMARPPDGWDSDLPPVIGGRNASLQALEDAMAVRELLFSTLPGLHSATFRVYRDAAAEAPELIIAGTVSREDEVAPSIRSQVMKAKLFGLRFGLEDGVLEVLQPEERSASS